MKKMPYSVYKSSYAEFPARDYDKKTKTILVDLPEHTRTRFPSEWERSGNCFKTPNGAKVYFWNSGYSENFLVEYKNGCIRESKTIPASLYARDNVIEFVRNIGNK